MPLWVREREAKERVDPTTILLCQAFTHIVHSISSQESMFASPSLAMTALKKCGWS